MPVCTSTIGSFPCLFDFTWNAYTSRQVFTPVVHIQPPYSTQSLRPIQRPLEPPVHSIISSGRSITCIGKLSQYPEILKIPGPPVCSSSGPASSSRRLLLVRAILLLCNLIFNLASPIFTSTKQHLTGPTYRAMPKVPSLRSQSFGDGDSKKPPIPPSLSITCAPCRSKKISELCSVLRSEGIY